MFGRAVLCLFDYKRERWAYVFISGWQAQLFPYGKPAAAIGRERKIERQRARARWHFEVGRRVRSGAPWKEYIHLN
jgi:hypothetical protein